MALYKAQSALQNIQRTNTRSKGKATKFGDKPA
jgi:hypothetical protein